MTAWSGSTCAVLLLSFGGALCAFEDSAALVQSALRTASSQGAAGAATSGALLQGRVHMLAGLAAAQGQWPPAAPGLQLQAPMGLPPMPAIKSYDCSRMPWMCKEPFNCHLDMSPEKLTEKVSTMATSTGHADLHTWCLPSTEGYTNNLVKHCLRDHDLAESAQSVYRESVKGTFGPITPELDGSYCFIEGMCSNTEVTYNTTVEEAEQMCDHRFGHTGWAKNFGFKDFLDPENIGLLLGGGVTLTQGFKHAGLTKIFLKAACAMGNYHCDVMYCRDTYCKNEYFVKKYGHLLPKVPGHLIQERDSFD